MMNVREMIVTDFVDGFMCNTLELFIVDVFTECVRKEDLAISNIFFKQSVLDDGYRSYVFDAIIQGVSVKLKAMANVEMLKNGTSDIYFYISLADEYIGKVDEAMYSVMFKKDAELVDLGQNYFEYYKLFRYLRK